MRNPPRLSITQTSRSRSYPCFCFSANCRLGKVNLILMVEEDQGKAIAPLTDRLDFGTKEPESNLYLCVIIIETSR
ncbi:hypothetical protein [Coleofasciculus sp. F4-SAH-05]|uniref:hypothetical protein n=1 Tax=Coleofasciculus sp. F4-SAH-05 TaxID=3069525 RepID=UPI0033008477